MKYNEYKAELRRNIEHAPPAHHIAPGFKGFELNVDDGKLYLCSNCSGRILGRGISLPKAIPIWETDSEHSLGINPSCLAGLGPCATCYQETL